MKQLGAAQFKVECQRGPQTSRLRASDACSPSPALSPPLLSFMCASARAYLNFEAAITGMLETPGGI